MQWLSGKLAALNRFLSKVAKRVLPCLNTLRKCTNKKDFYWTTEAEETFQAMKKLIAELSTLTTPKKEEELMVYLSAANEAISAVLLVEREGRQAPIHYVSRTLQGAEINYPPMEKLALTLVHAARRLRRYFQGHAIKVITNKPINQILNTREAMGRLAKWGIELEAYGIKYAPRSAIKGQVLADFLAETMAEDSLTQVKTKEPNKILVEGESMEEQEVTETKAPENLRTEEYIWKLYTDGASNKHGSRAGLILIYLEGVEYPYALRLNFTNSNNDAEYEALLASLRIAAKMKISHIPREENRKADALSKLAAVHCVGPQQAKYLIKEIHMGSCGMHDGPRRAVHKAMNAGYFWPSMHQDANNEISSCDSCQHGPFENREWTSLALFPRLQVKNFTFDNIVCMFGIPSTIITNNGTQLINDPFKSWVEGLGIKLVYTSVYHPQANGVVERANRSIMQGIKIDYIRKEEHG
ncbi:reverse transcriptase domain-containing protein [Tanacetum coccineum]